MSTWRRRHRQNLEITEMTDSPAVPAPVTLFGMLAGMWQSRAICVAAQLKIADALADGPRPTAELAAWTGTNTPSLRRLLRALARQGVFVELDDDSFGNSPLSEVLSPKAAGSMYAMAMGIADWGWRSWAELEHSVRTGEPAFDKLYGKGLFDWFSADDPDAGALFDDSMTGFSASVDEPVSHALDLTGVRRLVDVGGGHGRLAVTVLDAFPDLTEAVLFDQTHVLAQVPAAIRERDRLRLTEGDFFQAVPVGAEAYIMKMILHDWSDENAVHILSRCREAMAPGGRVLAAEVVLDPQRSAPFAYLLDLQMLTVLTGKERTEEEFRALYAAAGLQLTRVIPTGSMFSIVEGVAI
jgi:hypothetical protein